ncbi:MAG: hypothetical protein R2748_22280 [Bryobacterales bacterium]
MRELVKHSRDYDADAPELADYRLDERPPLEAQPSTRRMKSVDWTTRSSTAARDQEDARHVPPLRRHDQALEQYPEAGVQLQFNEALHRLLDFLVTALIRYRKFAANARQECARPRMCAPRRTIGAHDSRRRRPRAG